MNKSPPMAQWCLIGNIKATRSYGHGGIEIRNGTRHFPPGTKVYCFPAIWGDGYEKIMVIGRHRRTRDFVKMVIRSDWITNWRAKIVYNPSILAMLQEESTNWKSREHVDTYLLGLNSTDYSNCNLQVAY